jgi:hypothetical protein
MAGAINNQNLDGGAAALNLCSHSTHFNALSLAMAAAAAA